MSVRGMGWEWAGGEEDAVPCPRARVASSILFKSSDTAMIHPVRDWVSRRSAFVRSTSRGILICKV